MTMERWALLADPASDGSRLVRAYLLTDGAPSPEARMAAAWGSTPPDDAGAGGEWVLVPADAGLVGDDWRLSGALEWQPPASPPLTLADYEAAIEALLKETAQSKGYRGTVSCASYALDPDPAWSAEAVAFIAWRGAVWKAVYAALAAVQAGGTPPTVEGLISSLPAIEWPA